MTELLKTGDIAARVCCFVPEARAASRGQVARLAPDQAAKRQALPVVREELPFQTGQRDRGRR